MQEKTKKIDFYMKKDDFRLRTFLQSVEKSQYRAIRRAIIDLCKVTKSSYYNWLNGIATPSPRRRTIINAVAVKYGYSPVYPYNKISTIKIPNFIYNESES